MSNHRLQRIMGICGVAGLCLLTMGHSANASSLYWSVYNEEQTPVTGQSFFYTYGTVSDLVNDTNRIDVLPFNPPNPLVIPNLVGSGSDGTTFWNLINVEAENVGAAQYYTYNTFTDMVNDTNRLGTFTPDGLSNPANIVGSGSDGSTYWSLYNIEDLGGSSAVYATYGTLSDMLNDENRLGAFIPDGTSLDVAKNVVGSGSDGSTYWNLFNKEDFGELDDPPASYATYNTLSDMLNDENRLGTFTGGNPFISQHFVGSGALIMSGSVPIPSTLFLFGPGIAGLMLWRSRSQKAY